MTKRKESPKARVTYRICKYLAFDIGMACLPFLVDWLICYVFDLKIENIYDYSISVCIMTIVLSATSIKDAIEGKILKKKPIIFWAVIVCNILIVFISVLLYGIMEYNALASNVGAISEQKPFILFVSFYILSFLLGLLVQIGGGIDG